MDMNVKGYQGQAMEGTPPPDISTGDEEQAQGTPNPVIAALKTIAAAIAALQERGDPKATGLMQAFQALLQAFGAGGGQEAPPEEAPPEEGAEPPPAGMEQKQTGGRAAPIM